MQEEVAAVGVEAEVLQEAGGAGGEVGLAVADVGDGAAAEVEGPAGGVADDLDAVGVVPLLGRGDRDASVAMSASRSRFSRSGSRSRAAGIDERLVALQVDDDVGVELAGDLGDAVGAAGMVAARQHDGPPKLSTAATMRGSSVATTTGSAAGIGRRVRRRAG